MCLFPVDMKLALPYAITNPIEMHVHCLGASLLDCIIGNTTGSAVVSDDGCGWLGMAEFIENVVNGIRFLAIVEQGCSFRLSCTG